MYRFIIILICVLGYFESIGGNIAAKAYAHHISRQLELNEKLIAEGRAQEAQYIFDFRLKDDLDAIYNLEGNSVGQIDDLNQLLIDNNSKLGSPHILERYSTKEEVIVVISGMVTNPAIIIRYLVWLDDQGRLDELTPEDFWDLYGHHLDEDKNGDLQPGEPLVTTKMWANSNGSDDLLLLEQYNALFKDKLSKLYFERMNEYNQGLQGQMNPDPSGIEWFESSLQAELTAENITHMIHYVDGVEYQYDAAANQRRYVRVLNTEYARFDAGSPEKEHETHAAEIRREVFDKNSWVNKNGLLHSAVYRFYDMVREDISNLFILLGSDGMTDVINASYAADLNTLNGNGFNYLLYSSQHYVRDPDLTMQIANHLENEGMSDRDFDMYMTLIQNVPLSERIDGSGGDFTYSFSDFEDELEDFKEANNAFWEKYDYCLNSYLADVDDYMELFSPYTSTNPSELFYSDKYENKFGISFGERTKLNLEIYKKIPWDHASKFIKRIKNFDFVESEGAFYGNGLENVVINLVKNVPTKDLEYFLPNLCFDATLKSTMDKFDDVFIDSEGYPEFTKVLMQRAIDYVIEEGIEGGVIPDPIPVRDFETYTPTANEMNGSNNQFPIFPWDESENFLSDYFGPIPYGRTEYEIDWTLCSMSLKYKYFKNTEFRLRVDEGRKGDLIDVASLEQTLTGKPFQIVGIYFLEDEPELGISKGATIAAPLLILEYLKDVDDAEQILQNIEIALILVGGTELFVAKGLRAAIAVLDVAMGTAGLMINSYRSQIMAMEHGPAFLRVWDSVNGLYALYGIGKITLVAGNQLKSLAKNWENLKGSPSNQSKLSEIPDAKKNEIDNFINKFDEASDARKSVDELYEGALALRKLRLKQGSSLERLVQRFLEEGGELRLEASARMGVLEFTPSGGTKQVVGTINDNTLIAPKIIDDGDILGYFDEVPTKRTPSSSIKDDEFWLARNSEGELAFRNVDLSEFVSDDLKAALSADIKNSPTLKNVLKANPDAIDSWKSAKELNLPTKGKFVSSLHNRINHPTNPLSIDELEGILVRAEILDENHVSTMKKTVVDLLGEEKFRNHEDLLDNLNKCFVDDVPNKLKSQTQLNEYEDGLYWISEREEPMTISKQLTPGKTPDNEVDGILHNKEGILECKHPSVDANPNNLENNVFANLEELILKFREEGKLTQEWKDLYPKRYGQINLASGAFSELNTADDFVKVTRDAGVIGTTPGISKFTLEELKALQELHIVTTKKRIIIRPSDWY